jgi:hypothetical protein
MTMAFPMAEHHPPVYTATAPEIPIVANSPAPPEYTFPESFNIGTGQTPPFVDSAQLKGHLALLHSFAILRSQVDGLTVPPDDKDRRWTWFVSLAVER